MNSSSDLLQSELGVSETPLTVGYQLRRAREAAGLSQGELSDATAVPLHHLVALEEDSKLTVAAPFVAGYLRCCAQHLGLRAEDLITQNRCAEEIKTLGVGGAAVNKRQGLFSGSSWSSRLSLKAPLWRPVLWPVRYWFITAPFILFVLLFVLLQRQPSGTDSVADEVRVVPVVSVDAAPTAVVRRPVMVEGKVLGRVAEAVDISSLSSQDHLLIEVREESWVDVRDGEDQRLYRDLARAGEKIEIYGRLPFSLHVGNAPGLTLQLNGEPFAISAYRTDNSARFTLPP